MPRIYHSLNGSHSPKSRHRATPQPEGSPLPDHGHHERDDDGYPVPALPSGPVHRARVDRRVPDNTSGNRH